MNNNVNWFEIATTNLERAKDFYVNVFGIEFQLIEMPDSKMYMFGVPGNVGACGCLVQSEENNPSKDGTIIYFSCDDVNNEIKKITEQGGIVIVPKTDIGQFGFFAQFVDSEGNRIGLHSEK